MKITKHTALILSLICVIPLLFSCASGKGMSASDVRAGMSSDKLYGMFGTYGVYYGHDGDRLLFRDKKNRSVSVEFSEDMKTVAAVSSAAIDPTDTDIAKITEGMTASEVYAAFGAPVGTPPEYIPSCLSLLPGIITGSAGQSRGKSRSA